MHHCIEGGCACRARTTSNGDRNAVQPPLNCPLGKGGLTDVQAASATGRMVQLITDWVRGQGGAMPYASVRENGPDKGSHVHILLHVPEGLAMRLTRRWYRTSTKCPRP